MVTETPPPTLRAQEKAIAEQFIGGFPWVMVIWPLVNTSLWLALWPLVIMGILPLWAGFLIAIINITAAYLPSHDAQHHIIAPEGSRWHWFNEFIGWYSLIPMFVPLSVLRVTHFEHHRHTNDPLLDPDIPMAAASPWAAIGKALVKSQPRHERYGATLQRLGTPAAKSAMLHAMIAKPLQYAILAALAWNGYALEAFFLWWLPLKIGAVYINFYLSWAPHRPMNGHGRYRNTRGFKSLWGNIGSSGMQYHIIHHLYPTIPLNRHPAAFRALRPILEQRGCDLGEL
ncbi:MAG TPA: fatty acid desaturase [Sphingopyxis sp.]|nr:fatty acid desaturase [Sphingopyxis sp.]